MSDINIIDPYENYQMLPLESTENYGDQLLNRVQSLQVGFGSAVLRIDRDGLWMGAEDFATAPFSVDMAGVMTATSLDLSGYLQVGGSLADIQALIGDIGDISSDLGTISAGNLVGVTVTGGTVQTSSSGARVVMNGTADALEIYDASRKRMYLDNDELVFINSSGVETASLTASTYSLEIDTTGGAYAGWIFNASYGVYFDSGGADPVALIADGGLIMQGSKYIKSGDITPNTSDTYDLGSSSYYWNRLYVDDIYFSGSSPDIFDLKRILWGSSTSNPSGDGTLVYYDSGGTEGLRMQFGGADFQFDASAA